MPATITPAPHAIPFNRVTQLSSEPNHYVTEASDVGLPPGRWPQQVQFLGVTLDVTNEREDHHDQARTYRTQVLALTILNT